MIDNAVIHSFPGSPFIVKAAVNLRDGDRIRDRSRCETSTRAAGF